MTRVLNFRQKFNSYLINTFVTLHVNYVINQIVVNYSFYTISLKVFKYFLLVSLFFNILPLFCLCTVI